MERTWRWRTSAIPRNRKGFQVRSIFPLFESCSSTKSEERVRKGAEKLAKFLNAKQQGRLDGFFSVQAKASPNNSGSKANEKTSQKGVKRKVNIPQLFIILSLFIIFN